MTSQEFKTLYKQAGYKNKLELAKDLGLAHGSMNAWGSSQNFPRYVEIFLRKAIKAKKYDEIMANKDSQ